MNERTGPQERLENQIARVALRDRAAFQALYKATSAKLLAVTLRILKDRDEAEETLQEVYVKVWNNAARYKTVGYSPMTWLITIARNTAIDRLRKRPQASADIDAALTIIDPKPSMEARLAAASDLAQLNACFDELPTDRSAALRGAYLEGMSYQDLATRADVPLNTMRSWLRRGLIALRECMDR